MQKEETIASGKEKNVAITRIYSDSETGDSLFGTLKIPILASGKDIILQRFLTIVMVPSFLATFTTTFHWSLAHKNSTVIDCKMS